MAHELNQTEGQTEGQTSFVSARQDAWHRLGTVLPETFSAEDAMEKGLLGGWNVRKAPLTATVPVYGDVDPDAIADAEVLGLEPPEAPVVSEIEVPIENRFAVVRNNPVIPGQIDPLGVVGGQYSIIQNEAHAEFLNTLVDESGAHFETAGAIAGGRKVFLTMKLPEHISVGGVDRVDTYLAAVNSHDGSLPFTVMVTPIRIVCQNTLNLAWQNAASAIKIRHTKASGASIVSKARETLDLSFRYLGAFEEEAERLINTELTTSRFEEIIWEAFGPTEESHPSAATRREGQVDEFLRLFAESYTHEGVRETAWAGLNTLTEWFDHHSQTQAKPGEVDTRRAENAILNPEFKNRARRTILSAI